MKRQKHLERGLRKDQERWGSVCRYQVRFLSRGAESVMA